MLYNKEMIRKCEINDLKAIVKLHKICFKDYIYTFCGSKVLYNFYYECLKKFPDYFFVCERNGEILGYSTGLDSNDREIYFKDIYKKHKFCCFFNMLLAFLTFRPAVYLWLFDKMSKSNKIILREKYPNKYIYINWLCVSPKSRRQGICSSFLNEYKKIAQKKSIDALYLFVSKQNENATNVYFKNGFTKILFEDKKFYKLYYFSDYNK